MYFIAKHLKMKWSPEIISHELSENGIKFSRTSIYTVIKKRRPEWRKWLAHRGKKLKHTASIGKIPNRVSIEKRPKIVDSRKRFGDWEADRPFKNETQQSMKLRGQGQQFQIV